MNNTELELKIAKLLAGAPAMTANRVFEITEKIMQLVGQLDQPIPHDFLVARALGDPTVMAFVRKGLKVKATVTLRESTKCELQDAKLAIEDSRVWSAFTNQAT